MKIFKMMNLKISLTRNLITVVRKKKTTSRMLMRKKKTISMLMRMRTRMKKKTHICRTILNLLTVNLT